MLLRSINKKVLLVNSCLDSRCKLEVQTHDKKKLGAIKVEQLKDIFQHSLYQQADVIAIDEAQFFSDLVEIVTIIVDSNKKCILCGLDGDANQLKFGQILDLIPYADKIDKLSGYCSVCLDGTEGHFTIRKTQSCQSWKSLGKIINLWSNKEVSTKNESSNVLIGGDDLYMCVCRKHLMEFKNLNPI